MARIFIDTFFLLYCLNYSVHTSFQGLFITPLLTSFPEAEAEKIQANDDFVNTLYHRGHSIQDVMFLLTATTSGEEVNRIATMLHSNQITMADVDYLYRLYTRLPVMGFFCDLIHFICVLHLF